jgi:hypothetical protein
LLISLQDVKSNGIWRNGERGEMGNDKKDKDVIVISLSPKKGLHVFMNAEIE